MSVELNPYLFFSGNCKEAMDFYQKAFGGNLAVQTMSDVPEESRMPGADPNSVMHAKLSGGAATLYASDSPQASAKTAKVELSLTGADEAEMRRIWDALKEGGTVRMELAKQFWGDTFGNLTDKFGVDWMMNIGTNA